ncbi:ParB/RepB/Spo0J family partition protein [Streptomyces sp. NPDC087294]|uniref:ParB/RepB/Spo0J family partition protein n=1 Tax=Streptomyces sp. NPDC087294 TaxID=3365777 RepID=UPI003811DD78
MERGRIAHVLCGGWGHADSGSQLWNGRSFSLKRTEALSGNASKRNVDNLTASMKDGGWQGDPIKVAQHNDELYILDGHHRVAAAKRAGIDVPYQVVPEEDLLARYPGGIDDVTTAWAEVGPDKLVNRHRRPGCR